MSEAIRTPAWMRAEDETVQPAPFARRAAVEVRPLFAGKAIATPVALRPRSVPPPPPAEPPAPEPVLAEAPAAAQPEHQERVSRASHPPPRHPSVPPAPPAPRTLPPPPPPAGPSEAELAAEEARARFVEAAARLATARAARVQQLEDELVALAVDLAESILEDAISRDASLHKALARAALGAIEPGSPARLRASRESYDALVVAFGGARVELDGLRADIVLDPSIEGLGCVAESGDTRADGRVRERLNAVRNALRDATLPSARGLWPQRAQASADVDPPALSSDETRAAEQSAPEPESAAEASWGLT